MGLVIDKILGDALMHSHPLDSVSSDPASGTTGQLILNTTDHTIKTYYGGTWQTLHTLTAASATFLLLEDGFSFLQEDGSSKIQLE